AREAVLSSFFGSVGLWSHHRVTAAMERKTKAILSLLEISALADRLVSEMSDGESRRVVIGRALAHDPRALLLDEPSNSLDLRAARELSAVLRKLARAGKSILLVTHQVQDIIPEITRVILLKEGKVFLDGPKEKARNSATLSALYRTA